MKLKNILLCTLAAMVLVPTCLFAGPRFSFSINVGPQMCIPVCRPIPVVPVYPVPVYRPVIVPFVPVQPCPWIVIGKNSGHHHHHKGKGHHHHHHHYHRDCGVRAQAQS